VHEQSTAQDFTLQESQVLSSTQTMSLLEITPKIEQFVDNKMKSFKMDNQTGGSVLENLNQKNLTKAEQRRFARLKLTEKLKQQSIQFI
jgi:hypothetical protein